MKQISLYNVIFPIWFILFFPPVVLLTLSGNFIIDSCIVIGCFYLFRLGKTGTAMKNFYKKSILQVWLFGFLADIMGAIFLFAVSEAGNNLNISTKIISAISFNPFHNIAAIIIVLISMCISTILIFLFNYAFTFRRQIENKLLRVKVCVVIAIVTLPWTFLIPSELFYNRL